VRARGDLCRVRARGGCVVAVGAAVRLDVVWLWIIAADLGAWIGILELAKWSLS